MAQRFPERISRSFIAPSSNTIKASSNNTISIDMSQFDKFPWLRQEYVDEIEKNGKCPWYV